MGKFSLSIIILGPLLLAACATSSIGSKPADTPPRLVNSDTQQGVKWDNMAAFGPVPAKLQLEGDRVCATDTGILKYKAIGYHPLALDKAGRPIEGGGYLCANSLS